MERVPKKKKGLIIKEQAKHLNTNSPIYNYRMCGSKMRDRGYQILGILVQSITMVAKFRPLKKKYNDARRNHTIPT